MNTSDLKKLSDAMKEGGFHFLEVKTPDTKVRMVLDPFSNPLTTDLDGSSSDSPLSGKPEEKVVKMNSERVGVFAFGKIPLAIGVTVKKGDILGSIKGISMQDHVIAPITGKISAILVKPGEIVEFGRPLFRLTPQE